MIPGRIEFSAWAAQLVDRITCPILARLNARSKWWPLGHFPLRSKVGLDWIKIGSEVVHLRVPPGEEDRQAAELNHIYCDDPYRLAAMPRQLRTVLDVGANVGIFSLLARHFFPYAEIHCYEPDPSILPLLLENTKRARILVH